MTNKQLQLLLHTAQSLLSGLPKGFQKVLFDSRVQKGLAFFLAFRLAKGANSYLSRRVQNNWLEVDRWDPTTELIALTGGAGGIGKQIVKDLSQQNVKIVILDVTEPDYPLPPNVIFYQTDITSRAALKQVADQIRKDHGDPTVLINNAGVALEGSILDEPDEHIRRTMEVNTLSHFWTVKEFLPRMVEKDHGHIITVASLASFVSFVDCVDYSCSKASALAFHEGLTQEIRHIYGSKKVRTSIIHPLWVRTPMIDKMTQAGSHWKEPVLEPHEISSAVVGQIVAGNGGQVVVPNSYGLTALVRAYPNWIQEWIRNTVSEKFVTLRRLEREMSK
ncbi:putative short-chain dehydrogenases/reductase [Aspergillus campestris IBT 28561]|uniref:Short-chain dehydrogenase/reductase 3 n=1 Tax=Aspergillus campestris (strain IBT 28561) TaxID=1392248 RepID=A0A2I1D1H2_ASPC2|nr:putative short-chain dehydrogenases/reductase [Aspergillus campestris IBT 28561]PKY03722.1 putative short-chain dehydrogenases/reductase [Aspergillus campestris IBT 28561]